jgi:hypothetical protein
LVEQGTENPRVGGSIPSLATIPRYPLASSEQYSARRRSKTRDRLFITLLDIECDNCTLQVLRGPFGSPAVWHLERLPPPVRADLVLVADTVFADNFEI